MLYTVTVYSISSQPKWKKYAGKNYGCAKFQRDLGMELINYAIDQEWRDHVDGGKRPSWMRQREFLPCKCKKCFFCLNGYCSGIHHKPHPTTIIHEATGKKTRVEGCTDERVEIFGQSAYCRMCYRRASGDTKQKRKMCNNSKFGCPKCNEPICKDCWDLGYDLHSK